MCATSEGSWISAIFDEIALEGLEGVTLPDLWRLLAVRLEFGGACPLPDNLREQVWMLLLRFCPAKVEFFELPSPRPFMPPYDRSNDQDPELGVAMVAEQCPYLLYRNAPVQEGNIMGSCGDYKTRKRVEAKELRSWTAAQATEHWDQRLVAVASQELRHMALTPLNLMTPKDMPLQQYVCWEAIGRSRYNGLTTVGPWGLSNYCKDANVVFYIKNKLLALQLIASQVYHERHKGRFTNSSVLMLPRFFRIYKSHTQKSIDRLYLDITQSSSGHIPVAEIPERLGHISRKQVKKLLLTHNIRKFFETSHVTPAAVAVAVAAEAPASSSSNTKSPKEPTPSKRKQVVLQLRNPDLAYKELYENDQDGKEDKLEPEFLHHEHSFVDMPPERECLRAIARFGNRGITANELSQYVGISMLAIRGYLKHLLKLGQIKDYTEQQGRMRLIRYVASAQAPEVDQKIELQQTLLKLQCKDEPNIPESSDVIIRDVTEIVATINPFSVNCKDVKLDRQTQRHLRRKGQIVKMIDDSCIVQLMNVASSIKKEERKAGHKDQLCRRSLHRLLRSMIDAGIVNVYEVTLQYEQRMRVYRLVTHPKIGSDHELLRREILRFKSNFHLKTEELLQRVSQLPPKERKQLMISKKLSAERQKAAKTPAPKLLLARTLHEFLYYVVYELTRQQKPLPVTADLVEQWQKVEPALETRQFLEEWRADDTLVLPYNSEISWRTFIPPLPSYVDKPPGWVFFMDVMERMPLSLLLRICRIEREDSAERLRLQLKHPIRQHYLLAQLNLENIVSRSRLQKLYARTLCLLNHMGLIQVSDLQLGRDSVQRWVYLNRRARLLDTTASSEHNYQKVSADRTYMELRFEFQNRDQIAQYWAKLQHICVYTKLGFRKELADKKRTPDRLKPLSFFGPECFEQALELDNGTVPGDQLGAAGLSSLLFAHQFRNWSWVQTKQGKGAGAAGGTLKTYTGNTRKMGALTRIKVTPKLPIRRAAGGTTASSGKMPRRKCGPRDDIDRDAMRNMRTLRVHWLPEEDRVLKMGRAVYLFFDAPVLAFALNNVGLVCRDIIRRYLGICNKTTQACVRRLQFLMRMKRDAPDVPSWLYLMQTQPQFTSIYNERFMGSLKREYPTKTEQNEALLVHFVLVLSKLHHMITNSHGTVRNQFMLPDTVEEYRSQLRECSRLNDDQQVLYSNPSTETELQAAIAHGVLHSQVCCAKDKTLFNLQTFEIYKHFSEEVLNAAFSKARADSLLVAVKRRNIQAVSNRQISGPAHVLSSKYKYRLTYVKLGHSVYDSYFVFEQKLSLEKEQHLPSPHFAQLLLLGEWVARGKMRLSLHLPANILTVDTTSMSRPSGSSTDRILDHYSCILDNAPQTEYSKRLESECSSRQASRVRFHPANLSYRIQSCPYIQLSKLPLRVMHFFCALDALGDSVTISSARLEQGDCPFPNCIMRSGNYLNAVERIVHEQRPLLKQLVADALPQSQFQLEAHSAGTALTVNVSNILALTQQLEAYWRQLQQPLECKDLGKVLAEKTLHKLTDWRALCSELIDYEAHIWEAERSQEFEPAMNKEERARVQDVFVVHLPAIGMHAVQQQENHPQPQQASKQEADTLRTAVLAKVLKATYWRYTENTFETLLPALKEKCYDANAIRHMEDILSYIERQPLGVPAMELRASFPLGDFLLEALHTLADHDLIKRVGVASHMYVHKRHIRNWVVHTFHIKRLERERVQTQVAATPATLQAVIGKKRKEEAAQQQLQPASKKIKLAEQNSSDSESDEAGAGAAAESLPKRPSRRSTKKDEYVNAVRNEASHDAIVMRPQPWIRLNASLNRRVLDRWLGAVLSECISRIGCTVHSLFLRFPYLVPVDLMFLLELLADLGCLHLMELLQTHKVHVETTQDEQCGEQPVTELYEPTLTYIIAHGDAIGRLTSFIGRKKYSTEFI